MSDEKLIIDGLELIEKINNWRNKDFADSKEYTDRVICDVLDSVIEMIYDTEPIQPQGIDKDRLIEVLTKVPPLIALNENTGNFVSCIPSGTLFWVINEMPTTDGWIPCSERLPEDPQMDCYITINNGCTMFTYKGRYSSDACWRFLSGYPVDAEVTAWQPIVLPQPYKESE